MVDYWRRLEKSSGPLEGTRACRDFMMSPAETSLLPNINLIKCFLMEHMLVATKSCTVIQENTIINYTRIEPLVEESLALVQDDCTCMENERLSVNSSPRY